VAAAGPGDVDRAVRDAARAGAEWAALAPLERADALARYARRLDGEAEALAALLHAEEGKPLAEALAEVARAVEVVHHFAAEAARRWVEHLPGRSLASGSWVRADPIGVVAAIVPWNFPVALVTWKLAPALAAGCAVVVKPAIEAPLAAWTLCALADEAGLPAGLVSCLTGDGPTVGEALSTHPLVAKVAFTGSRRVAEQVAAWAAPRLKALTLELGGHGPLVVLPDADLDVAADVAVSQGYVNAGQACYAVNRVLVPPDLEAPLLERVRERLGGVELGPMATERGLRRHLELLEDAERRGAHVEGGEELGGRRLRPALVTGAGPGIRLVDEEPFTPIVAVMGAADVAAAVAEANRPDYGLVGYVCGRDLRACLEVAGAIRCGTVVVNGWRVVVPYAPYAGWRGSGVGAELGRPGLESFVRWQHVRVLDAPP
jgi:succinate-semialdehyde dehydrogenase/glutarate-semialdehyde dehydrogenase